MDNQNLGNNQPSPTPEPMGSAPGPMGSEPLNPASPAAELVAEAAASPAPQPVISPASQPATAPAAPAATGTTMEPVSTAQPSPATPASGNKKKLGLIIGIIVAAVILLGGIGAFAVMAITSSQPTNMLGSAINNLLNAKQISLDGTISFAISDVEDDPFSDTEYVDCDLYDCEETFTSTIYNPLEVSSVQLNLGSKSSAQGSTNSINSTVVFKDGSTLDFIHVEDVFMKDGVAYLKIASVEDAYDQLYNKFSTQSSMIPTELNTAIKGIIAIFDDVWVRVSIDEILDSELLTVLDDDSRTQIKQSYDCLLNTFSDSQVGSELSDLYSKNPFIKIGDEVDSFYYLSIKSNSLAKFINTLPDAKFVHNLASCVGYENYDASEIVDSLDAEEVASVMAENLPGIYAKFDGFMDYHLTELKIDKDYGDFQFSSNLKFTYPDSLSVSAPDDATSIVDIIQQLSTKITELSTLYYSTITPVDPIYEETIEPVEEVITEPENGVVEVVEGVEYIDEYEQ